MSRRRYRPALAAVAASTAFMGLGAYNAADALPDALPDAASPRPQITLASSPARPAPSVGADRRADRGGDAAMPGSVFRIRGGVPLSDFGGPLMLTLAGAALMLLRRR